MSTALQYYDQGLCILPVRPGEKRPYLDQWRKYTQERPTRESIQKWFETLMNPGIGLVTGKISNLVVLDLDTRSSLKLEDVLQQYPTDMVVKTGSGGYHLYYQHPGVLIGNRVNLMPGVDIRADGGFAVLPPTVHENGSEYQWISKGPAGKFPMEILSKTGSNQSGEEKWVTDLMKGVSSGGRNDAAARLAGYFMNKGMPTDVVEMLMIQWNMKNDPPLGQDELHTTVNSIKRYQNETTGIQRVELIPEEKPKTEHKFDLMPMSQYFTEYGKEGVEWAIQDWMPDKSIVFVVSPPEGYKTWLLLDLAVSLASGLPFLGHAEVHKQGPVLIVQQEDSHTGIVERLSVIMKSRLDLEVTMGEESVIPIIPKLPIYIHPSRSLRFGDKQVMADLEEVISKIRPMCVIIDPLYSTTSTDNYMAQAAEDMFQLKRFRDVYGCSFVIAHHSKKNVDPNSTSREDSWGSQFLNAFLEAGWQIRRSLNLADNEVVVRRHSKTMGNHGAVKLGFDISTGYPMKYEVTVSEFSGLAVPGKPAQDKLYELLENGPMNLQDLTDKTGKHKSTLSRQLKRLEITNMVQKLPDGRYKIVRNEEEENGKV